MTIWDWRCCGPGNIPGHLSGGHQYLHLLLYSECDSAQEPAEAGVVASSLGWYSARLRVKLQGQRDPVPLFSEPPSLPLQLVPKPMRNVQSKKTLPQIRGRWRGHKAGAQEIQQSQEESPQPRPTQGEPQEDSRGEDSTG